MATVTAGGMSLVVPAGGDVVVDATHKFQTPFENYAGSIINEIERILARLRSMDLHQDIDFDIDTGWESNLSKIRVVGEVWAYAAFTFTRTGGPIPVPASGDLDAFVVGTITAPGLLPESLAGLGSSNTGRLARGHVSNDGVVKLDAIAVPTDGSNRNIVNGNIITLAGMWPLDDWQDSEA